MPRIIAIANQKGGVGKTTTAINLSAAMQRHGRRPLLVDLDPQGSATAALGIDPEACERTIYDALHAAASGQPIDLDELVIERIVPIVPSNLTLSLADVELSSGFGVYALRDALASMPDTYDIIVLDCPPNLGVLTNSALAAAADVLIPQQPDYLAARGLRLLLDQINKVKRLGNHDLRLLGVALTMADTRTRHTRDVEESIRGLEAHRIHIFDAVIPYRVGLKDAAAAMTSIFDYDPGNDAATAYDALAMEVLNR